MDRKSTSYNRNERPPPSYADNGQSLYNATSNKRKRLPPLSGANLAPLRPRDSRQITHPYVSSWTFNANQTPLGRRKNGQMAISNEATGPAGTTPDTASDASDTDRPSVSGRDDSLVPQIPVQQPTEGDKDFREVLLCTAEQDDNRDSTLDYTIGNALSTPLTPPSTSTLPTNNPLHALFAALPLNPRHQPDPYTSVAKAQLPLLATQKIHLNWSLHSIHSAIPAKYRSNHSNWPGVLLWQLLAKLSQYTRGDVAYATALIGLAVEWRKAREVEGLERLDGLETAVREGSLGEEQAERERELVLEGIGWTGAGAGQSRKGGEERGVKRSLGKAELVRMREQK
ncbi:hypothetical protein LTS18_009206, partial [Coniosporium uncinatum]